MTAEEDEPLYTLRRRYSPIGGGIAGGPPNLADCHRDGPHHSLEGETLFTELAVRIVGSKMLLLLLLQLSFSQKVGSTCMLLRWRKKLVGATQRRVKEWGGDEEERTLHTEVA